MSDDDEKKAREAEFEAGKLVGYLSARGWRPGRPSDSKWTPENGGWRHDLWGHCTTKEAKQKQLRDDFMCMIYLFENLDNVKPGGARGILTGTLTAFVLEELRDFFSDKEVLADLTPTLTKVVVEMFKDKDVRQFVSALKKAWDEAATPDEGTPNATTKDSG